MTTETTETRETTTIINATVELEGYRDRDCDKWRKVRFLGRLVHEDDDGNAFYVTAGNRIIAQSTRDERINDYQDWETFLRDMGDNADVLEAVAAALGVDYDYVEEIP